MKDLQHKKSFKWLFDEEEGEEQETEHHQHHTHEQHSE
jgi:hypothetical protein